MLETKLKEAEERIKQLEKSENESRIQLIKLNEKNEKNEKLIQNQKEIIEGLNSDLRNLNEEKQKSTNEKIG